MKNKVLKIFISIPIIIILLFILPYLVSPILNNISMHGFSDQLYKYALPQNTKIIEKKQVCGKLNGNGNGMDFFACILVQSDMPMNELKRYYKDTAFKPAKSLEPHSNHIVDIDVVEPKGYKLDSAYIEREEVAFDTIKAVTDFSKYYVVMIYDGGYSADFDLRGH